MTEITAQQVRDFWRDLSPLKRRAVLGDLFDMSGAEFDRRPYTEGKSLEHLSFISGFRRVALRGARLADLGRFADRVFWRGAFAAVWERGAADRF